MIKYFLLGRHSHRTPLAYKPYIDRSTEYFHLVFDATEADVVILGFIIDVKENGDEILRIKKHNPLVKFVIISEEPLWDTVWSGDYQNVNRQIELDNEIVEIFYFNYFNSNIFSFKEIPYYITTDYKFISRYRFLFERNLKFNNVEIKQHLNSRRGEAFFVENRTDPRYNFKHDKSVGLSLFRSDLAKSRRNINAESLIVGKGWDTDKPRQLLIDWHLDKLSQIDKNFKFSSAIENTDVEGYISEKYFDSLATLTVPIISTCKNQKLLSNTKVEPFLNISSENLISAIDQIDNFVVSNEFVDVYRRNIEFWFNHFSDLDSCNSDYEHRILELFEVISNCL